MHHNSHNNTKIMPYRTQKIQKLQFFRLFKVEPSFGLRKCCILSIFILQSLCSQSNWFNVVRWMSKSTQTFFEIFFQISYCLCSSWRQNKKLWNSIKKQRIAPSVHGFEIKPLEKVRSLVLVHHTACQRLQENQRKKREKFFA